MRYSFQHVSLAGLVAAGTASAGVVSVPFEKRSDPVHSLLRRDGTLSLDALNNITGGGYYAEFSIGTPPQKLSFQLDTGSSDTWVNSVDADLCTSVINQENAGVYCSKTCKSAIFFELSHLASNKLTNIPCSYSQPG
jgi:hypothetical protein